MVEIIIAVWRRILPARPTTKGIKVERDPQPAPKSKWAEKLEEMQRLQAERRKGMEQK